MNTRIGYEYADRLVAYPQADNLSASEQPIRERVCASPSQGLGTFRGRRWLEGVSRAPTQSPDCSRVRGGWKTRRML